MQDPNLPPKQGEYLPPPPPPQYRATSDIPPDSPLHYSPAPSQRRTTGIVSGLIAVLAAIWAYGKYVLLFAFKFKFLASFLTMLVSFWVYASFLGAWAAAGLIAMFFIHEMGHVIEIRRQGMKATAPIFIPMFGAAIFMRQHAQSAIKQAEIGIAGPIAGTVGATAAFVLYGATHWPVLLGTAYFGFLINLFNLIPFGMLDGGWVLAPASKWFQVAGLAVLVGLLLFAPVSPILILIVLLGLPMVFDRFRNPQLEAYMTAGPASTRYALAGVWLVLVLYLAYAFLMTEGMLAAFVR